MQEEVKYPLVYIGFLVCRAGFTPDELLKIISPAQVQLPYRYILKRLSSGELDVQRLCRCYENYIRCYEGGVEYLGDGMRVLSTCNHILLACVLGGEKE